MENHRSLNLKLLLHRRRLCSWDMYAGDSCNNEASRSDLDAITRKKKKKNEEERGTPKEKRRWSFRRSSPSSRTENAAHKSTRSFDSVIVSEQLTENVLFMKHQNDQKNNFSTAYSSATRIQAAYRAYLARRALRALRGLVKLQALVRGHLVRKGTNATLRRLHALISIQVKARIQRSQLAAATTQYLINSQKKNVEILQRRSYQLLYDDNDLPNYMSNTESSKAKKDSSRSHSEPKQRPIKEKKTKRSMSNNRIQHFQPLKTACP
ncbi:protein IQ-DOMAIN 19-like [Impatiens glandulifera]|uniref:protein IQ-DOMAIN 19-like n=1 Tax=Impatiens glandulifera TaxID=253017 RepID=UPI001FB1916A|nr:protein IQ-DOMAIN 19-like [Impatiens glandulifera]